LPTNLQSFTQKTLTEVKIFQKVLGGYFFETPCCTKKRNTQSAKVVFIQTDTETQDIQ